jgi:hypothetical protein
LMTIEFSVVCPTLLLQVPASMLVFFRPPISTNLGSLKINALRGCVKVDGSNGKNKHILDN